MKKVLVTAMAALACVMVVTRLTGSVSWWWVGLLLFLFIYLPDLVGAGKVGLGRLRHARQGRNRKR